MRRGPVTAAVYNRSMEPQPVTSIEAVQTIVAHCERRLAEARSIARHPSSIPQRFEALEAVEVWTERLVSMKELLDTYNGAV